MTSKSRKPSFAFHGRRDTLGATLHTAAPGRREVAVLVSHLALCPALIFVLIFLNLLMDEEAPRDII